MVKLNKKIVIIGILSSLVILTGASTYVLSSNNSTKANTEIEESKPKSEGVKEEELVKEDGNSNEGEKPKEDNTSTNKEEVKPTTEETKKPSTGGGTSGNTTPSKPTPPVEKPKPTPTPEKPKPTPPPVEKPKPSVAVAPPGYNGGLMINQDLTNQLNSKLGRNKCSNETLDKGAKEIAKGKHHIDVATEYGYSSIEKYSMTAVTRGSINSNNIDEIYSTAKQIQKDSNSGLSVINQKNQYDKVFVVFDGSTNQLVRVNSFFYK